jgi:EpsI family protein
MTTRQRTPSLKPRGVETPTADRAAKSARPLATRLWTAVAVVGVCLGTFHGIKSYAVPSTSRLLRQDLKSMPYDLAGWIGADAELDAHVFEFLGADQAINRSYTSPAGQSVAVHVATWIGPDEWAPHPPEACYTSAGWELSGERSETLDESGGVRVQRFTARRGGDELTVLYWYRLGDVYFKNRDQARQARKALWGQSEWPPLIKVLIQSPNSGIGDPRRGMDEMAGAIDAWTSQL